MPPYGRQLEGAFLPQHVANHTGQNHQEDRRDLQESSEERPVLGGMQIPCTQNPLDMGLIGTPVPDPEDGIAKQDGQPGKLIQMPLRIDDGLQHAQLPRIDRRLERRHIMNAHRR